MAIVSQTVGGLGNQLFIYAMGRAVSLKSGLPLKLDAISGYKNDRFGRKYLLDKFNVCAEIATRSESYDLPAGRLIRGMVARINSFLPYNKRWILEENHSKLEYQIPSELKQSVYLSGYWQSYKYFQEYAAQIKKELTLKNPLGEKNVAIERDISSTESVSIHVRQDNVSHKLRRDYYLKAVELIRSKVNNPQYFIFSDSSVFARGLSAVLSAKIVDVNGISECEKDLWLMSRCRHHIVANSTFSWWGAWISDGEGKQVVVPASIRQFNPNIIPPGWMVLDY